MEELRDFIATSRIRVSRVVDGIQKKERRNGIEVGSWGQYVMEGERILWHDGTE